MAIRKLNIDSDNFARSGAHRKVEKLLDKMDLNYLSEQYFSPYTVDIYFPEWHLAIEVDGPYHSVPKDKVRDKFILETYGLPILRINVRSFTTIKATATITDFIEEYSPSAQERKYGGQRS